MITLWLWTAVAAFLGFLMRLFPTFAMPSWVVSIGEYATQGVTYLNGMHNWVPVLALRNAFVFLGAVSLVALAVRGFRIGVSLFTGGGGGAA